MPNFKLTKENVLYIQRRVKYLCALRVQYAEDNFPLNVCQIQDLVTTPERLSRLFWLERDGMRGMDKSKNVVFILTRAMTGVGRNVSISVTLPEMIFCESEYTHPDPTDIRHVSPYRIVSPDRLDPATVVELTAWARRATREKRLQSMVTCLLNRLFPKVIPTTGHLLTRWPVLASLVEDADFKSRMRNPPVRNLYGWDARPGLSTGTAAMVSLIPAADAVLLAASMLGPFTPDNTVTRASILEYEGLSTDRVI